ncbi:MAG: tetratricopeptide repeat protein [Ignavibacteriales bacterium]
MTNEGRIVPFERSASFYSKVGMKLLAEQRLPEAVKNFEKAIMLQHDNCEHYFNLAGVLSEMGNIKESIGILENALKSLEKTMPDCYFALGCNYFDLGDYIKSRENFEKYCEIAPKGNFILEAVEAVRFIDTNILSKNRTRSEKIQRLANKGKQLLEECKFDKSIRLLEKVVLMDDSLVIPRNNLSLAYYLNDEVEKAIDISRQVIKIDKYNSYANCNLALFYKTLDCLDFYENQINAIQNSRFDTIDEILNAVDILYKLGEDYVIRSILEKQTRNHNEPILWHFLAISCHNTGSIEKAIDIWNGVKNKLPHMTIFTDCFVLEAKKVIDKPVRFSILEYDVKMLADYMIRIEELIEMLIKLDSKEFIRTWESNDFVKVIVEYFIYRLEKKKRLTLIEKLADVEDDSAFRILDAYIKNTTKKDEVSSKCEEVVIRKMVAGDATANIVEFRIQ